MAKDKIPQNPPKRAPKASKKPKKPQEEAFLSRPGLNSPGLLFLLILIPVLFGILTSLISAPEAQNPVKPVETVRTLSEAPAPWETPPLPAVQGSGMPVSPASTCNYNDLIGIKPDENLFARLQKIGKAYRVLQPDAMMTMDYSADRVNLELDEKGLIRRVWCG